MGPGPLKSIHTNSLQCTTRWPLHLESATGSPLFRLSQCPHEVNLLCWIKTDAVSSLQTGLDTQLFLSLGTTLRHQEEPPAGRPGSISLGLGFPIHPLTPGPPPEEPSSRKLPGPSFPERPRPTPSPTAHPTLGLQLDAGTAPKLPTLNTYHGLPHARLTCPVPLQPPCLIAALRVRDSQAQRG